MKERNSSWAGRKVLVLGLARSGVAVAKLLHGLGARVTVNDRKPREACPEASELEELGIPVICGGHPPDLFEGGVELVVKNPGITYSAEPVERALALGIPVVTEVEIAAALSRAPIVGITGSNGKTTTTTLVGKILTAGGLDAVVAGNIGQALADVVSKVTEKQWLVAELSSFQLKGTKKFRPRVAALLNVFPAHLDYHKTMEDYIASKNRIFQNQTDDDVAVLNADSEVCRAVAEQVKSRIWWFSRTSEAGRGVFVKDGWIIARTDEVEFQIMPVAEVALRGVFNLENALAAAAVSLACGTPKEAVREVLRTFQGVEHRLEYVATVAGVRYYNDSKATNAQAATKALESFTEPVVWIAGGLDRGVDFKEMVPVLRGRVKAVVAYGQAGPVFLERAAEAGISERHLASDVQTATRIAHELAAPGDVVLLSPACASWDQYTSFEERGSIFKQAVHTLAI
jgi:UDP-N-acetylmuramoylalanine--D-glutamate ligase